MAKKPTNREATNEELAELLVLKVSRVHQLVRSGVLERIRPNAFDVAKAVPAYIAYLRGTAGATGGTNSKIEPSADLEAMIEAVKAASDYNDARTLKTKIDALRSAHALAVEQARYMPLDDLREQLAHVTSILRGGLLAMAGEMPPHLEGLTAPEIERQIDAYVDRLLTEWSEGLKYPEPTGELNA